MIQKISNRKKWQIDILTVIYHFQEDQEVVPLFYYLKKKICNKVIVPKGCIGMKYGYMSVKIILSALLRHYKFRTNLRMEDLSWKFEVTMKLVNTHLVKIEKRNFKNSKPKSEH